MGEGGLGAQAFGVVADAARRRAAVSGPTPFTASISGAALVASAINSALYSVISRSRSWYRRARRRRVNLDASVGSVRSWAGRSRAHVVMRSAAAPWTAPYSVLGLPRGS